jgi:hypothetical protein
MARKTVIRLQYLFGIVARSALCQGHADMPQYPPAPPQGKLIMEKQGNNDIAAFPELFDGLEQFIEEQARGLKRTSAILAVAAAGAGGMLFFVLKRLV